MSMESEERLNFLYENLDRGNRITLRPGVAYCLRALYELIRDLVEGACTPSVPSACLPGVLGGFLT